MGGPELLRGGAEPDAVAVRPLQASDAGDYRAIRLSALRTAPDAFGSAHDAEAARPAGHFAERLASSLVLGAYGAGGIVGTLGFKRHDGPKDAHKGFLWGFFVEPGHRRRGVGAALLAAALDAARGAVEQVTLSVTTENAAAIALYERFGFARYGTEPRALKGPAGYADEALMVLFLRAPAASAARSPAHPAPPARPPGRA